MFLPVIPKNIRIHRSGYPSADQIPAEVFDRIRARFAAMPAGEPLVSVNIIAWNEERNILQNLSSLSSMACSFPVEFIYVDNNSIDRTSEIIRRCGITPVAETRRGYGFARQAALEHSKGKYVITGDSDTIYPPTWIETMVKPLREGKGFASYGTYSFLPGEGRGRLGYAVYEFFRNIIHSLRTINRPELAVGGVNFCFPREAALQIGFIRSDARMEDGKMAFALSKEGKLYRVYNRKAVAWTVSRSVDRDGSLLMAMIRRIPKQLKWLKLYFSKKS